MHTAEIDEERKPESVRKYVRDNGITHPVLLDTSSENWRKWQQEVWPTVYLIDKRGHARFRWTGELNWNLAGGEEKMARRIQILLDEK